MVRASLAAVGGCVGWVSELAVADDQRAAPEMEPQQTSPGQQKTL